MRFFGTLLHLYIHIRKHFLISRRDEYIYYLYMYIYKLVFICSQYISKYYYKYNLCDFCI